MCIRDRYNIITMSATRNSSLKNLSEFKKKVTYYSSVKKRRMRIRTQLPSPLSLFRSATRKRDSLDLNSEQLLKLPLHKDLRSSVPYLHSCRFVEGGGNYVVQENEAIKQRLEAYTKYQNDRNYFEFGKGKYGVSYKELNKKFDQVSFKINCLLAGKAPVNFLSHDQEENVLLLAGLRCHFKVACRDQPIPLRVRLAAQKGLNYAHLSVSSTIERPDKDHSDKSLLVVNKQACLSYYGKSDKEKLFVEKFAYITLECTRECSAILSVTFGNKKVQKHIEKGDEVQLNEEEKLDNSIFKKDISTKMLRIQRKLPDSMSMIKLVGKPDQLNIKVHRRNVIILKDKLDLEDRTKKLVLSNKKEIGKHYDVILEEKVQAFQEYKRGVIACVLFIKLRKVALKLYRHFTVLRTQKRLMEKRLDSGLKIRRAINSVLLETGKEHQERLQNKLNSYSSIVIYSSLTQFYIQEQDYALYKSRERVYEFMINYKEIIKLRYTIDCYLDKGML
eukprot:TRINITY_DN11198_c0_g1_i5.p1 TRINITY_DN11198_c0_g1~~TRINITY_DN11198_c0_g1_i5.p1  ORF type:complete len:503 (+),score=125.37 TRINITY_DN11198_c0_g1_i5:74-1582(+)